MNVDSIAHISTRCKCCLDEIMIVYMHSRRVFVCLCVFMCISRLDFNILYEICQGLVENLCGSQSILAGVGLDKLRFLCYTGKGCYKNTHLQAFTSIYKHSEGIYKI